ncbi:MAG: alpha-ketoacid dehydrogenase subunit beta [Chloroflexi bacterium]|nr:alpha-ketoacid dehydrogenase subunit beta [Chloroflexota bacterium]
MTTIAQNPLGPGIDVPGREERYRDAFQRTLRDELERDPDVFIMGEDVAGGPGREHLGIIDSWGGPFAATKGLIQDFGARRIVDTPISEAGFLGAAVGAALTGTRPVVDLMYFDFIGVAFDQILSNASKSRYMFGGQSKIPLTIFARSGAGTGHAAQHSSNFYSILAHLPGLKVIAPSDPYSVRGLLAAAIRDDDPVIVCNHKLLINLTGFVPDESYTIELGKGRLLREGSDVTLVGMSWTSEVCKNAADKLAEEGISAEVVDLLSLSPLDEDIFLNSVAKTNNVIIVDEDSPRASMASEVSAVIADKAFDSLDGPIKRVTAPHTPVPYSKPLELAFMPNEDDVIASTKALLGA